MFDETKLSLRLGAATSGYREYSVLASHAQVTLLGRGGKRSLTEDIIRPPKVLRRATAACTWSALTAPEDPGSLDPTVHAPAAIARRAYITTTDAAAYNHLALKHLTGSLPPQSYHLRCDCVQHRTASVIESVTSQLGILNDCFCLAKAWKQGDLFHDVRDQVRLHVEERLRVVGRFGDLGETWGAEALAAGEARAALLRVAYVDLRSAQAAEEPEPDGAGTPGGTIHEARQERANAFLAFFHGSTKKELVHICTAPGCGPRPCASREDGLGANGQSGSGLVRWGGAAAGVGWAGLGSFIGRGQGPRAQAQDPGFPGICACQQTTSHIHAAERSQSSGRWSCCSRLCSGSWPSRR